MNVCRILIGVFVLLYLVALAAWAAGTWGLFGATQDPLSGIFLVPLGKPWLSVFGNVPEPVLPWVGVFAPLLNIAILMMICRVLHRRA